MVDKTLTATQADKGEVQLKGDLPQWDENKREIKNAETRYRTVYSIYYSRSDMTVTCNGLMCPT